MRLGDHQDGGGEFARLLDENEQLRTALESALDENGRVVEDRDRLLTRVTVLGRELHGLHAALARAPSERTPEGAVTHARSENSDTQDEELRVAFEELQVLTEELEVANGNLQRLNDELEERVAQRTRELTEANRILRRTELRLSTLVNGIPQLIWRATERGEWTWSSTQWSDFTALSDEQSRGTGWLTAFHPEDRAGAQLAWEQADTRHDFTFEGRIRHDASGDYRHFQTRASPVRGPDGAVLEWLGTSTDIHDLLQLREQQAVLVGELQHRTRNLMAVVQAVMFRTLKGSTSLEEFARCIEDRLDALARVQGLLSRRGAQRITFDALLRAELSAHGDLNTGGLGAQVLIEGPSGVPLETSLVQTFALALHELATNAVKYGALSTSAGRLAVRWQIIDESSAKPRLHVEWRETGVSNLPADGAKPHGGGYGRELIERALPYQMGAVTSYRFTDEGVLCTIDVDIPQVRLIKEQGDG
jgi:two-component system CheB/CheR fusion protein